MRKKFTLLIAACALLSLLTIPTGMWGQRPANGGEIMSRATATLNIQSYASANSWSNQTQYLTATVDGVTFTANYTGSNNNTGKYYSTDHTWRFYANESATLTIAAPNGGTLSSVTATFTVKDNGTLSYNSSNVTSGNAVTVSGSSAVFSIGSSSGSKGKIWFTEIAVTYTTGGGSDPVDPTITFNNGNVNVGKTLDLNTLFSSNSTGAVSYSITSGSSYASITDNVITGVAVGSVTVEASQAATASYNAATATATITVNAAPALSSIAITTPPTKTTYVVGETFDPTGMVVTATYSDNSTENVTASCTWTPSVALTTSDDVIEVSYTEGGVTKTAIQTITVNTYTQPTEFEIGLNNTLFGTSYTGSVSGITDDSPIVGAQDNVTVTYAGSGNHYVNNSQIRFYPNNKLTFEAPAGYEITKIVFTSAGTWAATISANSGTYTSSTKTWTGSASSVLFTGSGSSRCDMSKATITLAAPAPHYNITYATGLTNGAFAATGNPTSAAENESVTVSTVPDDGYRLATMTYYDGTNTNNATISGNTGTFTMPAHDVTVSATFELIPEVVAEFVNGVYSETLLSQASFDTWKAYSVSGDQVWAFASGYGAKISGHVNSTNYANEDWFISPKMQVENGKLDIGFDCVGRYGDDGMITIYYSTDYTGIGDPNDANWTEITPDPAIPYDAGNWTYQTIACNIEQTGNVYFAFKYVSTDSQAGTFEVKNFTAKQYYTITLSATNGSITSDPENLAVVGATVELTATPNTNYHFVSWSITPVVTIQNNAFTMPAANVTVGAEFAQNATCTVTFVENGVPAYSDDDIPTGAIGNNLPDSPFNTVPANLDFLGWSLSPIDTYTETAPNLVGDTYNVEGNVTFYAVYKYDYSYTIGGGTPTWTKVTDASTLAAGDQLVIASDDDATSKVAGEIQTANNPYMEAVDAEFETSTMVTLPNDAIVLTLGGSSGSWTLTNNNRLLGSDGTKMKWNSGTTTWSISISNGDATIGVSEAERFLYNATSPRFKTYTSGTTSSMLLPQLYRLEGGSTTVNGTYYLTSVTEKAADATISTETTWSGNNTVNAEFEIDGGTLTVGGLLINPDEDNIFIVNGGQLVTSSKGVKATLWKGIEQYTVPTTTSDENKSNGWYLIASPVVENTTPSASNGFLNGDATENTYDLYYYEEPTHYWMNYEVSPFDIQSKKGYLYANGENNGTILEFVGTVYPSNVNVTVGGLTYSAPSLAGFNLIGNPFTCTAYLTGGMSFYRMNAEKTALTAVNANMPINPMEGVFVEATAATQSATFTTTAPSSNSNVRKLNIKVSGRERVLDNAIVSFSENGSLSKFMLNPEQTCLYIPQDGSDYAIVSCDNEGETPVCFKAEENGNYILSVNIENVEMNYLHLIDNMTGADVDLLATPSYSFEARTTDYASRFRLVFSANNGSNENGNETFAYYNGSEWVISNMGEATLQVVDVMGRVLSSETVSGNANVSLNQTPGVYMLRLVNSDSVKTQKIVVR